MRLLWVGLILGCGLALAGPARADNLDLALTGPDGAGKVRKELRHADAKNVGVLPFRVQKGKGKETFIAGPLNAGITARLENALAMTNSRNESLALGIIRDAAGTAAKAGVGSWSVKPAERRKLFDVSYPLAWGDKKVKADAFLTGVIRNTGDRSKTTVVIQAFYKKDPQKLVTLTEMTFATDRDLLSEIGTNWSLTSATASKARSRGARDQAVVGLVRRRDQQQVPPTTQQAGQASARDVGGLTFKVYYDGVEQPIQPVSTGDPDTEYFVPPVKPGTKVTFSIVRNGSREETLGAVIKVNGKSTCQKEEGDSKNLRRWIYRPTADTRPDIFEGFYVGEKADRVQLFDVVSEEESAKFSADLGQRVGYIEVDVFASGKEQVADTQMTISTRGLSRGAIDRSRPKTSGELLKKLREANGFKWSKVVTKDDGGGVLVPGQEVERPMPNLVDFPNPVQVGRLVIKYYDPAKMAISKN